MTRKPRTIPARPVDWPFPDLSHLYEFIGDVVSPIDIEWAGEREARRRPRRAESKPTD